jgi:uncharacterized protein YjbI with pentapeptide repeats
MMSTQPLNAGDTGVPTELAAVSASSGPQCDQRQRGRPQCRTITPEALQAVLEKHRLWVENGCREEQPGRADLSYHDLEKAHIAGASLKKASLRGANMNGADLSGADLTEADCREADLQGADLSDAELLDARFQNANLKAANLTSAKHLSALQVGGANIHHVEPKDAVSLEGIEQVDEGLKHVGKLYLTLLVACIFSILIVLATKDAQIVANAGEAKLPILDVQIPTVEFFVLAPLVILGTYATLHLHLLRTWETMGTLPAVFPDGSPIDRKIHPLLINSIVLAHWRQYRDYHPMLFRLHQRLSFLTAYLVAPAALLLIWGRYLVKQDQVFTSMHLALFLVASGICMFVYALSVTTLDREPRLSAARTLMMRRDVVAMVGIPGLLGIVFAVLFGIEVFHTYADLSWEDVSAKPAAWIDMMTAGTLKQPQASQKIQDEQIVQVKGAKLSKASLQHAKAKGVFLVRADLTGADLEGADLQQADLRQANLDNAHLEGAHLPSANLEGAYLNYANLLNANMDGAHLESTKLRYADLRGVQLSGANLQHSDLEYADLEGARPPKDTDHHLDGGAEPGYTNLNYADLAYADLQHARLQNAYLTHANLTYANLTHANLTHADLTHADLVKAVLQKAKYDKDTRWPRGFEPHGAGAIELDDKGKPEKSKAR